MHLTLRQLNIFEAVARHLSCTRAAEELHLSQPAVSMQLKQLEDNIGLALFEQLGKKLYLTEAGRQLHHYSRSIAQQLQEAEEVFNCMKGLGHGRLSVSVASTANYFAARLLSTFSRRHPDVLLNLDVTNRENLLRQLEDNQRDLVIMGKPPEDEIDVVGEVFMENPLVVIAPSDHPLRGQKRIPLTELLDKSFVVREQGSGTRSAMERFFEGHGIALKVAMEMTSSEAIKQAVVAGMGLGIVSIHTLELEITTERLVILDVDGFPILRHWYIVHRREKRLSPIAQAFKEYVLNEAANIWPA
ncbi:LysR family transcriptional regulator [Pseudomonas asiatica]|uniref:LysR family transcriptional regulator n=1 Tax=Pseudomonas monteilii TaxID=76759 RepID=A0A2N1IN23_9PSED|nr:MULTISPECIES: LysR family transcriptional regulator [Pseudomonas]PKI19632.1 LysR family transcriptional regulator [Pseudomonas monteilii]WDM87360.1 LysR family transcriptional regulator [Pseudomonas asiatica]